MLLAAASRRQRVAALARSQSAVPRRCLSTVFLGTLYERYALAQLPSILPGLLALQRVGGAGDRGIDLQGWWHLPHAKGTGAKPPLRVLVQCKASASTEKRHGPVILREIEGVIARQRRRSQDEVDTVAWGDETSEGPQFLLGSDRQPLVAIICSSSGFSKQTNVQTLALRAAHVILVHLPLPQDILDQVHLSDEDFNSMREATEPDAASRPCEPVSVLLTPQLVSSSGPLGGQLEVRWTRLLTPDKESSAATNLENVRPRLIWKESTQTQHLETS